MIREKAAMGRADSFALVFWVAAALAKVATAHPEVRDSKTLLMDRSTLRCEHYDADCIREAQERGTSVDDCYGEKVCDSKTHYCIATWFHKDAAGNATLKHKTGLQGHHFTELLGLHNCQVKLISGAARWSINAVLRFFCSQTKYPIYSHKWGGQRQALSLGVVALKLVVSTRLM